MIDTLWVGYKDVDGEFSANSSTLNVAFVAGSEDFDSVRVGTINVGNGSVVTNESELEEMLGSSDFNSASATSLQPLPGSDTITVNVNHIEAQISLGVIESAPTVAGADGDEVPTNLDFHINVEGYVKILRVDELQSGSTVTVSVPGQEELDPMETTKEAANLLKVAAIKGGEGMEAPAFTMAVRVGQAGLNDGTETVLRMVKEDGAAEAAPDPDQTQVVRTSANTVLATLTESSALGATAWRAEMNHLQYRMGELRDHKGFNNGVWARVFQGKDEYGSQNVENDYFGFQVGYDHKLEGTNVILGGAVSYSQGESTFETGDGDSWSLAFTAYGTWLAENGMFVDGTLKYGMLSTDLDMRAQNGADWVRDTASYDTNAMSVSVEAGWRLPVTSLTYVEPQVEVMYGHVRAADYTWAGYDVTAEGTDAFVGRAGFQAGMVLSENTGSLYFRASVLNDFRGESDTTFRYGDAKRTVSQDLGGSWYELGLGGNWNVADDTYLYADFQYADGGEIDTPWRWSVGVRHAF